MHFRFICKTFPQQVLICVYNHYKAFSYCTVFCSIQSLISKQRGTNGIYEIQVYMMTLGWRHIQCKNKTSSWWMRDLGRKINKISGKCYLIFQREPTAIQILRICGSKSFKTPPLVLICSQFTRHMSNPSVCHHFNELIQYSFILFMQNVSLSVVIFRFLSIERETCKKRMFVSSQQ